MKNKKIMALLGLLIAFGSIGIIMSCVENQDKIQETLNYDTSIKNQTEYNLFLQKEITPISEMVNDILTIRKVNSDINLVNFQSKIRDTVSYIDKALTDIGNQSVSSHQASAKENTVANLNKLKYILNQLSEASKKEGFKTQGNTEVDKLFTDLATAFSDIDDNIGIGEEIK